MQGFVPLAAKRARARLPRHYVQRHLAERSGTAGALGAAGTGAVDAPINPYEGTAKKYELASLREQDKAHRHRPAVTPSKSKR